MKTEWEFQFETTGFHFKKEHKYKALSKEPLRLGEAVFELTEFRFRVVPSSRETPPNVEQIGSLYILIPFPPDETTKRVAYALAHMIAQRITFEAGSFRINYGLVTCERILETPEEMEQVGEKRFCIHMQLIEDIGTPAFESSAFSRSVSQAVDPALMAQFNETKLDESPIRKFLGFFKVLESRYHKAADRTPLKVGFKASTKLCRHFKQLMPEGNFDSFIDTMVEVRNRCAHLKLENGFGYVPNDPNVEKEVRPHLFMLEALARLSISEENKDQITLADAEQEPGEA
jgi:hypothetical protein